MCGIFGFFDRDRASLTHDQLVSMGERIAHRGPDGNGVFESPGVGIGNMRLAIIDLAGGLQPFISDDGKVALVQNGEIYNYIELRNELLDRGVTLKTRSDTEVLLWLYLLEGKEFVHKLNGMFVIAVADQRTDELLLVRDPLGVKPLYVCEQGSRLYFGSEIKSILDAGVPRRTDHEALHHFLTFGFVPPPFTMFAGIRHLMPGHMVTVSKSGSRAECWWDLSTQQPREISQPEFDEKFLSLLDRSVQMRMRADVPFGAFLSGGLDSSTIVGLMQRHSTHPVRTFAIGFEDPRFDESEFSRQAAERFRTDHTLEFVGPEIVHQWARLVYHCDQPHSDVSFLPYNRLAQLAVKHVKMALTGDGGDELFGGYEKYTNFFEKHPDGGPNFARDYHDHISLFTESDKRTLYSPEMFAASQGLDTLDLTTALLDKVPHWDRRNQALWLDVALLLPGNNLVKPDRMGMAESLEARDPFLDKQLAEFAFTVSGEFKMKGNETRAAYKLAVRNLLGDALTYRPKRMFTVPIGEWFRDVLRPATHGLLKSEQFRSRGLFDPARVDQVLADHESGKDQTRQIRQLMALELWHRIFMDQSTLSPQAASEIMESVMVAKV